MMSMPSLAPATIEGSTPRRGPRAPRVPRAVGTPDPAASASLYCSGCLDGVIARVVAPVWRRLAEHLGRERRGYLWMLRYARGGEHLKVRWHGAATDVPTFRRLLEGAATTYLDGLGAGPDADRRPGAATAPPIDREDAVARDRPDRTLLWTTYGRSLVSLGPPPWSDDDTYLARLTLCLGRGAGLLFDRLDGRDDGLSHGATQGLLLHGLLHGLAAAGLDGDRRTGYFLYHRDWLLRAALRRSRHRAGADKMAETLARFDRRIADASLIEDVAHRSGDVWDDAAVSSGEPGEPGDPTDAWRRAVAELGRHVAGCRDDAIHSVDPFAAEPLDVPLFKLFHGFANQLGLTPLNEAFTHHLLAVATGAPGRWQREVRLTPHPRETG